MSVQSMVGIVRSLLIYYAIPGRKARLKRFYAPFVPSGSLCFDIGAHVGNRSEIWRTLGAKVIAVEPQPACVSVLRFLFRNKPAVTLVPTAIGEHAGEATLFVNPGNPTISTLSEQWIEQVGHDPGFDGIKWQPGATVTVTTLQALIDVHGLPAFVKIDVEGFEEQVLAGLHTAIPCLSFEYLPVAAQSAQACVERLEELGSYRYNRSIGESHQLVVADWCDAEEMKSFLHGLQPGDGSGDIYARLESER